MNLARAQLMHQNATGQRITLYLGPVRSNTPGSNGANETAFRFQAEGPVPGFYWVDGGFGYALSGPLSRGELASVVHRQLV